jgi:DNA-binding NarL/FixJ family response regulator
VVRVWEVGLTAALNLPLGLVVEDEPEVRRWMADVMREALPGVEVATVADLGAARRWLAEASPEDRKRLRLALVDLVLPDGSGIDLIRQMRAEAPQTLAVVITAFDDDANLLEAMAAGAEGFLLKRHDTETLVRCLRRIDDGEPPLTPSIARRLLAHFQSERPTPAPEKEAEANLTPRELEVLQLLARGSRVAEAATRLGLTEQTVATYVKIIYRKLGISSRAEAALEASRRGLV